MSSNKASAIRFKLSKIEDKIKKFNDEHSIDDIKMYRAIFCRYNSLKGPAKEEFFSSKVTKEKCESSHKNYMKFNRLAKTRDKLSNELKVLTSNDNISSSSPINTINNKFIKKPPNLNNIASIPCKARLSKHISPIESKDHLSPTSIVTNIFESKNTNDHIESNEELQEVQRLLFNEPSNTNSTSNRIEASDYHSSSNVNNTTKNDITHNARSTFDNSSNQNNISDNHTTTLNVNNTSNYDSASNDVNPPISNLAFILDGCQCHNCFRNNYIRELPLQQIRIEDINKKRNFRFIKLKRNPNNYIKLCNECTAYLTQGKETTKYKYMWPAFIWSLLVNTSIQDVYGTKIWQLLPTTLREWFFTSTYENILFFSENTITLEEPPPLFYDNTFDTSEFDRMTKSTKLGEITSALDKYLIPSTLCPWGCTEYIHECGQLPFDLICRRYLPKVHFKIINNEKQLSKLYSARDDFFRYDVQDYDCWVFNPEWKVIPNLNIDEVTGLNVCTCRNHNGGAKKFYLHTLRTPHHLPSYESDQLCHAVIRSRTIKSFKASEYCNSYQMYKQTGSFQGIDTCDLCNFGDFSFSSRLLSEAESRSIHHRADINDLLNKFEKFGYLSQQVKDDMKEMAKSHEYSYNKLKKYIVGSTYLPLQDSLIIQGLLNADNHIIIIRDGQEIRIKKNWFPFLYYVQKIESNGYGAQFYMVVPKKSQKFDTRLIWYISCMMTKIPCVYNIIEKNIKEYQDWKPWILLHITQESLHFTSSRTLPTSPFKSSYIRTIEKLCEKIGTTMENYSFDMYVDMNRLFFEVEEIQVIEFSNFNLTNLNSESEVILITRKLETDIGQFALNPIQNCKINKNGAKFELRFLGSSLVANHINNDWKGSIFSRHGTYYQNWWIHDQNKCWSYQAGNDQLNLFDYDNIEIAVYVKLCNSDEFSNRDLYMKYISAQNEVKCKKHKYCLITEKTKGLQCISPECTNKVTFCCPEFNCNFKLCNHCIKSLPRNNRNEILTHNTSSSTNTLNSTPINASMSESDDEEVLIEPYDMFADQDDTNEATHTQDDLINEFDSKFEEDCMFETDCDIFGCEYPNDMNDDSINDDTEPLCQIIPTTNALLTPKKVSVQKENWLVRTNGHVLLNQTGKLLTRRNNNMNSSNLQKYFIQSIAATVPGRSIPLLYPEGMMFPSIFWKMLDDGSIIGAIPSCLMNNHCQHSKAFDLPRNVYRSRATSAHTQTGTNHRYVAHSFDVLTNLTMNGSDSRLVLNRGLIASTNETGLALCTRSDDRLYDSVDSKKMVRNLCSSQKFHKQTFFLTYTCNQKKHPGLSKLKNYVDNKHYAKFIENYNLLTFEEQAEYDTSVNQAIGNIIVRNWMEAKKIFVNYLTKCPTSPFFPVNSVFSRDEYQNSIGNLPHIHMMVEMSLDKLSQDQKDNLDELIRAYICDIIRAEDIDLLKSEGIINGINDVIEIEKDASTFLPHKCSMRCLKRIAYNGNENDYVCRKPNNNKISDDFTRHTFKLLNNDYSYDVLHRLSQIDCIHNLKSDKNGKISSYESNLPYFNPKRHIPRTNRTHDQNISPVESKTFAALRSMQNIQLIAGTNGMNKYVCKYIVKIDENSILRVDCSKNSKHRFNITETEQTNTKVTSSKINEDKANILTKRKNQCNGRSISYFQQIQMILGYPEIRTDLQFVSIPTVPLEQRIGVERSNIRTGNNIEFNIEGEDFEIEDGFDSSNPNIRTRIDNGYPQHRQFTDSQMLLLQGIDKSTVSIDKISYFGIRPPELLHIFKKVGDFFRWFNFGNKPVDINKNLNINEYESHWINGLCQVVTINYKALPEIEKYIKSRSYEMDETNEPKSQTFDILLEIMNLYEKKIDYNNNLTQDEKEKWDNFDKLFIYHDDQDRHLPIPVFDYIKPTIPTRFILHILLSLGEFETEYDLLMHPTLRQSLRYAKLIGSSDDQNDLQKHSDMLLKNFIENQLIYYPNGKKSIENFILSASETFNSIIIRNEVPMNEMPPVLQSNIDISRENQVMELHENLKKNTLDSIFIEIKDLPFDTILDRKNDFYSKKTVIWNPLHEFRKTPRQNDESYKEQKHAISRIIKAIDRYCDVNSSQTYIKCQIICGFPGSGKTFVELYVALYAISKGLKICTTSVMCKRSVALGGIHIHVLFGLPFGNNLPTNRIVELSLIELLYNNDKLLFLKTINVIFLDEIGQVSAETLCVLDIILRRIKDSNIYMGGVLLIGTLDHKQLPPVTGHPFLTSPHVFSSFEFSMLKNSVRASGDLNHQRVQEIVRQHRSLHTQESMSEIKHLLLNNYTFCDSWDDPEITPDVFRTYGKKRPANEASAQYINQVKNQLSDNDYLELNSEDYEKSLHTLEDWRSASAFTTEKLNKLAKEPKNLLFFVGGVYECTYNKKGVFSHTQLAILLDLPDINDLKTFRDIYFYLAPNGLKDFKYDKLKRKETYVQEGWKKIKIGVPSLKTYRTTGNIKAQRKQYGVKHFVTSTLHVLQGLTIDKIATEVNMYDSDYNLWDVAQLLVLLSRTRRAKDIIFVGNKETTVKSILSLLTVSTQWTDYMENVIRLVTINSNSNTGTETSRIPVFAYESFPLEYKCIPLPRCNTGYVYFIVSIKDTSKSYIGQTMDLHKRINQHNSGFGTDFTNNISFRPWILYAFIVGFEKNRTKMLSIEHNWKSRRLFEYSRGVRNPKQLAQSATNIIQENNENGLRLLLCFNNGN